MIARFFAPMLGLLLALAVIVFWRTSFERSAAAAPEVAHASVVMDLRTQDGIAMLHAFAEPGIDYRIDTSKLHFAARPYENPREPEVPMRATIGAPAFVPSDVSPPGGGLVEYEMPVNFLPTEPAGMYRVNIDADPGFAKDMQGHDLEDGGTASFNLWWHDGSNGDPDLADARARFAEKDVYGFGGIDIGCPRWHNMYTASVPIRVKDVLRERDTVDELWTGSTIHWGNDMALHFFAIDPLRVVVVTPSAKPAALGGSNQATSDVRQCPAIALADFQIDAVLSVAPPPEGQTAHQLFYTGTVKLGMTRNAIAWLRGYPNEFGDRAKLDSESTWQYFDGPRDGYAVTFANGRVAGFPTPELPAYP